MRMAATPGNSAEPGNGTASAVGVAMSTCGTAPTMRSASGVPSPATNKAGGRIP